MSVFHVPVSLWQRLLDRYTLDFGMNTESMYLYLPGGSALLMDLATGAGGWGHMHRRVLQISRNGHKKRQGASMGIGLSGKVYQVSQNSLELYHYNLYLVLFIYEEALGK